MLELRRTKMTTQEARELRRLAEARVRDLGVDRKIRFVLANEPNANYRDSMKHLPLPGTGYIMAADFTGIMGFETRVYDATRPGVYVYQATGQGQEILRFNEGPWLDKLLEMQDWLEWAVTHETAAGIVDNFAPLEGEA